MPPRRKETEARKGLSSHPLGNGMPRSIPPFDTGLAGRVGRPAIRLGSIEGRVGYYTRRLQV